MQKSPGTALRPLPETSCQRKLKANNSTTAKAVQELKILSKVTICCGASVWSERIKVNVILNFCFIFSDSRLVSFPSPLTLESSFLSRQGEVAIIFFCFIFSDFDFEEGRAGWQLIIWLNSHLPHPSSHRRILKKKVLIKSFQEVLMFFKAIILAFHQCRGGIQLSDNHYWWYHLEATKRWPLPAQGYWKSQSPLLVFTLIFDWREAAVVHCREFPVLHKWALGAFPPNLDNKREKKQKMTKDITWWPLLPLWIEQKLKYEYLKKKWAL